MTDTPVLVRQWLICDHCGEMVEIGDGDIFDTKCPECGKPVFEGEG